VTKRKKKRRSNNSNNRGDSILQNILLSIFGLITLWLLASIYLDRSPVDVFKNISKEEKEVIKQSEKEQFLTEKKLELEGNIMKLEKELAKCAGNKMYPKAIIDITSNMVNMRDAPSLTSNVLAKLPDSTQVQIIYYDQETLFLEGKSGKWAKILYASQEGWVWGNYLKEIQ